MAEHQLWLTAPRVLVTKSDIEVEIKSGDTKLGELHLSKGTIDWRPKNSKTWEYSFSWEKFAEVMETYGNRARAKKL